MTAPEPFSYTRTEVESYLPSGWRLLAGEAQGGWEAAGARWRATVVDGVGMEWPLVVPAADATRLGRLPALRAAVDEVWRERLGRGTRGLGRGRFRAA